MRLFTFILPMLLCLTPAMAQETGQETKSQTRQTERAARQAVRSQRRWWLGRGDADTTDRSTTKTTTSTPRRSAVEEPTAAPHGEQNLQQGKACMRLERTAHNFGDVRRKGGDLIYDFPLVNEGTVPLVITRVITSCSCLKASYSKRPIAPGAREVIRITYEPHKREAGAFNKVIQIYSNSSLGRELLTVQGNSIDEKQ